MNKNLSFELRKELEESIITFLIDDDSLFSHLFLREYHISSFLLRKFLAIFRKLKDSGESVTLENLKFLLTQSERDFLVEIMTDSVLVIKKNQEENIAEFKKIQKYLLENYVFWREQQFFDDLEIAKEGGFSSEKIILEYSRRLEEDGQLLELSAAPISAVKTLQELHKEILADAIERKKRVLNNESVGVKTGFIRLDRFLRGGFSNSHLYILAGRPGMGKTTLAVNIAFNASLKGARTLFLSLEMSGQDLAQRVLSAEICVPSARLHMGTSSELDLDLLERYDSSRAKLYIDQRSATISQIKERCLLMKKEYDLDFIVIDYLGLINEDRKSSSLYEKTTLVSGALKALAKDLNLPILVLCQLSRAVEQRDSKYPQLSDLRDSGSIEQDADVVMFVHRDDYYPARKKEAGKDICINTEDGGKNLIIIAKNRYGGTGEVPVFFDKELTVFRNMDYFE